MVGRYSAFDHVTPLACPGPQARHTSYIIQIHIYSPRSPSLAPHRPHSSPACLTSSTASDVTDLSPSLTDATNMCTLDTRDPVSPRCAQRLASRTLTQSHALLHTHLTGYKTTLTTLYALFICLFVTSLLSLSPLHSTRLRLAYLYLNPLA